MKRFLAFLVWLWAATAMGADATVAYRYNAANCNTTASTRCDMTISSPYLGPQMDICLASIFWNSTAMPTTVPAGWTEVRTVLGSGYGLGVWSRTSATTGQQRWQWAGVAGRVGSIDCFDKVSQATPVDAHAGQTTSGTSHAAPSVTTTKGNAVILAAIGNLANGTWTPPAGMAERVDLQNATGVSLEVSTVPQATAGATGDKTATSSLSANGAGILVALRSRDLISAGVPSGPATLVFQGNINVTPLTTYHLSQANTSEIQSQFPAVTGGRATAMYVTCEGNLASGTTVHTFRNGGADTALTCTRSAGQSGCQITGAAVDYVQEALLSTKHTGNTNGGHCRTEISVIANGGSPTTHNGILNFGYYDVNAPGFGDSYCGPSTTSLEAPACKSSTIGDGVWIAPSAGKLVGMSLAWEPNGGANCVQTAWLRNQTTGLDSDVSIGGFQGLESPGRRSTRECSANCSYAAGDRFEMRQTRSGACAAAPTFGHSVEYDSPQIYVSRETAWAAGDKFGSFNRPWDATAPPNLSRFAWAGTVRNLYSWASLAPGANFDTTICTAATSPPTCGSIACTTTTAGQTCNDTVDSSVSAAGNYWQVKVGAQGTTGFSVGYSFELGVPATPTPTGFHGCVTFTPTPVREEPVTNYRLQSACNSFQLEAAASSEYCVIWHHPNEKVALDAGGEYTPICEVQDIVPTKFALRVHHLTTWNATQACAYVVNDDDIARSGRLCCHAYRAGTTYELTPTPTPTPTP